MDSSFSSSVGPDKQGIPKLPPSELHARLLSACATFDSMRHLFPPLLFPHLPPPLSEPGFHVSPDTATRHTIAITNFLMTLTSDLLWGKMPLDLIQHTLMKNQAAVSPKDHVAVDLEDSVPTTDPVLGRNSSGDAAASKIQSPPNQRPDDNPRDSDWKPRFWRRFSPKATSTSHFPTQLPDPTAAKATPPQAKSPGPPVRQSTAKNVIYGLSPFQGMNQDEATQHYARLLSPPRIRTSVVGGPSTAFPAPPLTSATSNQALPAGMGNVMPRSCVRLGKPAAKSTKERLPPLPAMASRRKVAAVITTTDKKPKPIHGQLPIGGRGKRAAPPAPLVLRSLASEGAPADGVAGAQAVRGNHTATTAIASAQRSNTQGPLSPRTRIVSSGVAGNRALPGVSTVTPGSSHSASGVQQGRPAGAIMLRIKPQPTVPTAMNSEPSEAKPAQKRRASTRLQQNAKRQKADPSAKPEGRDNART